MTFEEIKSLISLINKSDLAEFRFEEGDQKIVIRTSKYNKGGETHIIQAAAPMQMAMPAAAPVAAPAPAAAPAAVSAAPAAAPAATEGGNANAGLLEIKSPIVGTFYRSAAPDKPALVKIGDVVDKGSVVCIVEAMKLFNQIESEVKGKIVKILVEDASPVEYDQPLFLVDPK
jgi:acetyl-CoA carboxylase biotin carboxyl carrier protein